MKMIAILLTAATLVAASSHQASARAHFRTSQYAGQVTTVSGTFQTVTAVTFDPDHQVFYAFSAGTIYQVTLAGVTKSLCRLNIAKAGGLAYDSANQLIYATDPGGYAIWSLSLSCNATLMAGGTRGTSDGQGTAAQFQMPSGIALDATHQVLYVADFDRIRAVTVGATVTTFTAPGSIGEIGYCCYFPYPVGLAYEPTRGVLYVADTTREMIETVNAQGRLRGLTGRCVSRTSSGCDPMQVDGSRARAGFASPSGIAISPADGSLYVVEPDNNDIRRINARAVTTLAGSGMFGNADGLGIVASFYTPEAVAVDPVSGTMLVADTGNRLLRIVTTQGSQPPPPPHGTITYDPPAYLSAPNSIAVAADGTAWFSEQNAARIGRRTPDGVMREFLLPRLRAQPGNVVIGPDGAVWFTDTGLYDGGAAAIARLSSSGVVTEYPVGAPHPFQTNQLNGLVVGPDGNLWFTDYNDNIFGYITPLGQITEFPEGFAFIASGFDGNIWTAGQTGINPPEVYRYATDGTLLNAYNIINGFGGIYSFANGSNQAVWYVYNPGITELGYLTVDGTTKTVFVPHDRDCLPYAAAVSLGRGGNEWYAWGEEGCNAQHSAELASASSAGQTTLFPLYEARSGPSQLTVAPDGTLWFADPSANKIGKLY